MSTHALTILGSSSALPTSHRFPSAQIVQFFGRFFLIDCGEGTQMQLRKIKVSFAKIQAIFISHLHGDHFLGVFGVLSSFNLLGRTSPLTIYCPPGLQEIIMCHMQFGDYSFNYKLHFVTLPSEDHVQIFSDKKISVIAHKVSHRVPCWAFEFTQNVTIRNLKKEYISQYNLSISQIATLKSGNDVLLENSEVLSHTECTYLVPKSSYVYITDTRYLPSLANHIKAPTLLYHEATFEAKCKQRAHETYHSTSEQAACFAKAVNAKKLIIGHFSARYKQVDKLLNEAREIFPETYAAEDLQSFSF